MLQTASVPFVDLKRQYEPLRDELLQACEGVLDRCDFIGGAAVRGFEADMAQWLGVDGITACANATSGLYATLKCLGIGPGDEVITTVHTAIPTPEAITLTGARVVFADIDPETCTIDPADVERRITDKTKALLPVHLYGHPADLDALLAIAKTHGLPLVEDCAQAQGARYRDRRVGTCGDAAVFSFFPSKNLGGFGDGGAITARDPELMKKINMYCNHGREEKYTHLFEGMNSRLDTIKAAMLRIALPHLDEWNEGRRRAARWYRQAVGDIEPLKLPVERDGCEHVYHVYVVQVPDRDDLARFLGERGIKSGLHYPMSLNLQPAYEYLNVGQGHFPVAERVCGHILSLPIFPTMTEEEVGAVCDGLRAYFA